jgi:hypothetical protein
VTFLYVCTMYPGLVYSLHYSPSSPFTFLKLLQQVSMFHIHTCRKYINFIYPPLPSSFTLFYIHDLHCLSVYSFFSEVLPRYFTCKYTVLWISFLNALERLQVYFVYLKNSIVRVNISFPSLFCFQLCFIYLIN